MNIEQHVRQTIEKVPYFNAAPLFRLNGQDVPLNSGTCLDIIKHVKQSIETAGLGQVLFLPAEGEGGVHHTALITQGNEQLFADVQMWQQTPLSINKAQQEAQTSLKLPITDNSQSYSIEIAADGTKVTEKIIQRAGNNSSDLNTFTFDTKSAEIELPTTKDDNYDSLTAIEKQAVILNVCAGNTVYELLMDEKGIMIRQLGMTGKLRETERKQEKFNKHLAVVAEILQESPKRIRQVMQEGYELLKPHLIP